MSKNQNFEKDKSSKTSAHGEKAIDLSEYSIPADLAAGKYANYMQASHAAEEFMLDFVLAAPGGVKLVSRIIVSPAHMKRIVNALQANIARYEERYGEIEQKREQSN